jgi:hypothetical protein
MDVVPYCLTTGAHPVEVETAGSAASTLRVDGSADYSSWTSATYEPFSGGLRLGRLGISNALHQGRPLKEEDSGEGQNMYRTKRNMRL